MKNNNQNIKAGAELALIVQSRLKNVSTAV